MTVRWRVSSRTYGTDTVSATSFITVSGTLRVTVRCTFRYSVRYSVWTLVTVRYSNATGATTGATTGAHGQNACAAAGTTPPMTMATIDARIRHMMNASCHDYGAR